MLVLVDITHREFQDQPEWREAVGAASSLSLLRGRPGNTLQRLAEGVGMLLTHGPALQGAPARAAKEQPAVAAQEPPQVQVEDEVLNRAS